MDTFMAGFGTFLSLVEKVLRIAVMILIGFMMFWICLLVPTRYFFNYTPAYGEELSRYVFVWIVFLCMPILAKTGSHMAIETITSRIRGAPLKFFRIVADLLTIVFLALMIDKGCFMVSRASFQTSPGLGLSMSWVYVVIPIGCGIMSLFALHNLITLFRTPAESVK